MDLVRRFLAPLIAVFLSHLPAMLVPHGKMMPTMTAAGNLPPGVAVKQGVRLRGLDERMYPVIEAAADIWLNHSRRLVITSGLDGRHRKGSRHYLGMALDFRTRGFGLAARRRVTRQLSDVLGSGFKVLRESDHIHVEYPLAIATGKRRHDGSHRTLEPGEGATAFVGPAR